MSQVTGGTSAYKIRILVRKITVVVVACIVAYTKASLFSDLVLVSIVCPEPDTYSLVLDFIKMLAGGRCVEGGGVKKGGLWSWGCGRCAQVNKLCQVFKDESVLHDWSDAI